MKVTQQTLLQNYLRKQVEKQKDLTASKEQEIQELEKVFNAKVKDVKTQGEIRVLDEREKNKQNILEAIKDKEGRLSTIKETIGTETNKLEKQKEILIADKQQQIANLTVTSDEKYRAQFDQASQKSNEINEQTRDSLHKLQVEADHIVQKQNSSAKLVADDNARNNDLIIKSKQQQFLNQRKQVDKDFRGRLELQKREHLKNIDTLNNKQTVDINQRKKTHQTKINHEEKYQADLLKQMRVNFQQKYQALKANHEAAMKTIKSRFANEKQDIINKFSSYKSNFTNKSQDDFYRLEKLDPQLVENEKFYDIHLPVGEHEKENVRLTAHGRKINISITRKFSDRGADEEGSLHKTSRSEMFTKEFGTKELLNPSDIKQSYADGVISFRVSKL